MGTAGGFVFYISDDALNGLEAALVDQDSALGQANAVEIANKYTISGFNDWYLPSTDELLILYAHQELAGGISHADYWSSTAYLGSGRGGREILFTYYVDFNDG